MFALKKTDVNLPSGTATYQNGKLVVNVEGGSLGVGEKISFTHAADCDFAKDWVASVDLSSLTAKVPDWLKDLIEKLPTFSFTEDLKKIALSPDVTLGDMI